MLMQLFKGVVSSQTLLYACPNAGNNHRKPCLPSGHVGVSSHGAQHKYDMNLTLQNAAAADAGLYSVRVEVVSPETGGVSFLHKTFQVVVDGKLQTQPLLCTNNDCNLCICLMSIQNHYQKLSFVLLVSLSRGVHTL